MTPMIASNMVRCSSCGCFVEYDLDKAPNLGKYGVIVNRVRKCVGGDVVVVRMDSIRYRLDIVKIKYDDGEKFHETIVKGPYCDIVSISDGEDLFRRFLEITFVDSSNFNKNFDFDFVAGRTVWQKLFDSTGLLSNSISELELKLTTRGF